MEGGGWQKGAEEELRRGKGWWLGEGECEVVTGGSGVKIILFVLGFINLLISLLF